MESHLLRHMAIHRGEAFVGESSVGGGYFCDLCGVVFRQHFNLIKHWRTGCPLIRVRINFFLNKKNLGTFTTKL